MIESMLVVGEQFIRRGAVVDEKGCWNPSVVR